MDFTLSYPSHRVVLSHDDGAFFTKVIVYVEDKVYNDMVQSKLKDSISNVNRVVNESELLNGFLRSLLLLHNNGITSMRGLKDTFDVFQDELEYYVYCLVNDLRFNYNEWFYTAYIQCDIFSAKKYVEDCSITLLRTVYPEFNYKPKEKPKQKVKTFKTETESEFKCNPEDYSWFLEQNEIDVLYHFSPIENIVSIQQYSICSLKYLDDHSIPVSRFASSEASRSIDKWKKVYDYVHLLFEPGNPMIKRAMREGRLSENKLFEINPIVLFLKNTCYTIGNAASNSVKPHNDLQFLLSMPFSKFHKKTFWDLDEEGQFLFQSEVLVKSRINKEHIYNL